MKKITIVALIAASAFVFSPLMSAQEVARAGVQSSTDNIVRRGADLTGVKMVPLGELLKEPKAYEEKTVTVEGVVKRACTNKGCWMEIAPKAGEAGMRVTFKDYGFFVPLNSQGMNVKAEGRVAVKTLSRAQADHYESEGARLKRNVDGSANEVTFVATGVELKKTVER